MAGRALFHQFDWFDQFDRPSAVGLTAVSAAAKMAILKCILGRGSERGSGRNVASSQFLRLAAVCLSADPGFRLTGPLGCSLVLGPAAGFARGTPFNDGVADGLCPES